jgi:hypothetical protein
VFVKAVHGAVVGAHRGGVTAENDDPMPTFTVTPVADRVTEGQPLKWKVTLSAPADVEINPGSSSNRSPRAGVVDPGRRPAVAQ